MALLTFRYLHKEIPKSYGSKVQVKFHGGLGEGLIRGGDIKHRAWIELAQKMQLHVLLQMHVKPNYCRCTESCSSLHILK